MTASSTIKCGHAKPCPERGSGRRPLHDRRFFVDKILIPRKVEFKGGMHLFHSQNIQGIPHSQVKTVLEDLEKMIPQDVRKWIDWEQTKSDQGPWPRKIMVSLWFKHDTGLTLMIE